MLDPAPGPSTEYAHRCPLPWPVDPEAPEGHVCECGRKWVYQPAHWDPLLTLDELRMRQEAGAFLRSIIPSFHAPDPAAAPLEPRETAVIVHLPPA